MWIVRLALRRPYTFVIMSLLITLFGGVAISTMPVDIFPYIDIPVLSVLFNYGGLSTEEMTNRVVTVEEGWGPMGVGAEISAKAVELAFDYLDAPPARVHQVDVPLPYAANLELLSMPSVERIVAAVKAVTYR